MRGARTSTPSRARALLDEGYFLHVEDVDLRWRVRQCERQGAVRPGRRGYPPARHTSHASLVRVELHKGVGPARYFRKRAANLTERLVAWLLLAADRLHRRGPAGDVGASRPRRLKPLQTSARAHPTPLQPLTLRPAKNTRDDASLDRMVRL